VEEALHGVAVGIDGHGAPVKSQGMIIIAQPHRQPFSHHARADI